MVYDLYTDQQLINGLVSNDKPVIEYFFCMKCSRLFSHIAYSVYGGLADLNELVNEFYLYISSDNWKKVLQFDFRSKLMTWIGVVAVRFFIKKRDTLIENQSTEALIEQNRSLMTDNSALEYHMDLHQALNAMPNQRYRMVIDRLDLQDMKPEDVAEELGVTVDNLYNIHRRALAQLKLVMTRKEDYYG